MTGVWNILGDSGFNVRCIINNSVVITTTTQVPLTAETDRTTNHRSTIVKTAAQVPLITNTQSTRENDESRSAEPTETTKLSDVTSTTVPSPLTSTGRTKKDTEKVLWIVIGSVGGGLVIITAIIICVCVLRKRSQTKYRRDSPLTEGYRRQGTSIVMTNNTLCAHEHSANPAYSLARAQGPVDAMPESRTQEHDDDNELVMAENCLYSHEVGLNKDRGIADETSAHSPDTNSSELYAKVNKTPREQ